MASLETCYMCGDIAISREHVPPKCIFPESAEMDGEDYRKNLITVPSCGRHNTAKSGEDEFLMVSLAGLIGNNSVGYRHRFGKVNRAIRRSSSRLLDKAYLKREHFVLELETSRFVEVIWGTPDVPRLRKCFEHIAYGLHYHHFGQPFVGKLTILPAFLASKEKSTKSLVDFIRHKSEFELRNTDPTGGNPGIFCFNFGEADRLGLYLLRMHFYGGIDVYASFQPQGVTVKRRPHYASDQRRHRSSY